MHDEKTLDRIVSQGVLANVSALVSALAEGYGETLRGADLIALAEQAFELASPVLDYESAARDAGWTGPHTDEFGVTYFQDETDEMTWACREWESLCAEFDIDPHENEVYEHWLVDQYLADDLIEVGEKVEKDFAGLCVWARTTTGQLIAADACIRDVAALREKRYREAMGEG